MKKLTVAVFVLCLSLALLAGCAVGTADPTSSSEPQASDTSSQTGGESDETGGSGVPSGAMNGSVDLMADILPQSVEKKQADSAFVSAQMEFAVSLFKESLKSKESEKNANDRGVLVSPLSAQLALAMVANGAKGDTLLEMEQVLGGGMPIAELNQYLSAYANGLPSTEGAKLNLNNAIWFKDGFCVNADFLQTNADYYGAPAYMAPLDDTTVDEINNWVEQNTDGMIKKLFDSLSGDAVMVLVNTLLFDAEWENAYGETDINDGIFTAYDGTERSVTMLSSTERYLCSSTAEGFIRYYKDKEYAFAAFLPTDGTDIFAFASSLTAEQISSLLQSQAGTADVRLPKFTFACDL